MTRALAIAVLAMTGCASELDPPWQLDHDRIVAVRATPPGIAPGQTATIDALLSHKGGTTSVAAPALAAVVSPASLSDVLTIDAGRWVVTAPSEDRLAAARSELKLDPGAPVGLEITVAYPVAQPAMPGQSLVATKVITLGPPAENPPLAAIAIDGKPAGDAEAEIIVGKLVKVPLSIAADDAIYDVAWLTSCGTMHDFDLPQAYLKVEADDPTAGELGVVVRDAAGGVSWRLWPIRVE